MKPNKNTACPICQQENACAVSNPESCWCMKKDVPKELIKKAQALQQEPSCICQTCINRFLNNQLRT